MANPRTIARLEALIRRRAAYCLQFELQDPRAGFVTILRVELSPDLSAGKIYYSVLGDQEDRTRVAHMLEHAAGFIQRQVGRVLQLRRIPHLRWIFDESVAEAARLGDLIQEARARDRAINPAADQTPALPLTPPSSKEAWEVRAIPADGEVEGEELDEYLGEDDDDDWDEDEARPDSP